MRVEIQNQTLFKQVIGNIYPELSISNLNGITTDSRLVQENDIFLAMRGKQFDGTNYIQSAQKSGAILCVTENYNNKLKSILNVASTKLFLNKIVKEFRRNLACPIIGITGTNGKTTIKELLLHVISAEKVAIASKGNFNSTIGAPLSIFNYKKNTDYMIFEMGASQPGEIEYICNLIKPDLGIISNISEAHTEHFGTINKIAETKSALFQSLPKTGIAFVNKDDQYISKMKSNCNRIEYSFISQSDYKAKWLPEQQSLSVNNLSIKLNLSSQKLAYNALAVYTIASYLGIDKIKIKKQIESFQSPDGRGNIIDINGIKIINDCYNANLESAKCGIDNLVNMSDNYRKIVVIGDMLELGEVAYLHHHNLGKYLKKKNIDAVFAFGNLTQHTIKAMNGSSINHQHYQNKKTLISALKAYLTKKDILYIKGSRSMKMEQIILELSC